MGEVLKGEGIGGIGRILASYLASRTLGVLSWRRRASGPDADSLESWVRGRFGKAIFDRFFREYTRKLWGISGAELSADWAGQRIAQLNTRAVVRQILGRGGRAPRTFAKKYCYPRHGIGQIFRALTERFESAGGHLLLGSRAGLVRPGKTFEVEVSTPEGLREVTCQRMISTIPLPDLVAILDAPEPVRRAAGALRFRSLRFLNLLLDGPPLSSRTWVYVPDPDFFMTRVQFPANRSPENCPRGRTSIQLEIPCSEGDEVWTADESSLLERGLEEAERFGLDVRSRLLGSFSTRALHAYPIYRRGYLSARAAVLEWIDSVPGLATCGRQGRFDYIFFDRAMEHGLRAARSITGRDMPPERPSDPLLPEEARSIAGEPVGDGMR